MSIRWLFVVLLGSALLLVAINVFDEDLAAETRALLLAPPNPYGDEQNLYLIFMGFDAPPGQSTLAHGQARVAEFERELEATLKDPSSAGERFSRKNAQALVFKGKIDFLPPLTTSIWAEVESHKAEIAILLDDNRELYQRYLSLHGMPGYYDKATPSFYTPSIFPPRELRSLFLADFALRMKSPGTGQQKQALADLEGDLRTWRAMLLGEGSLVSKMLAIACLQGDYLVLADMIADRTIDLSGVSSELERLVTSLNQTDWKIGKSFAHEFRMMAPFWEQLDSGSDVFGAEADQANATQSKGWKRFLNRLYLHFYKPQATENLHAKAMLQVIAMADAEPGGVIAASAAYSDWAQLNRGVAAHYVYNPVGKILAGVGAPNYASYALRAYDVAALQRLVKLGYELRRQEIAASEIPHFIQQHPEWATHPVSGQAFSWDADKYEIALNPLARQAQDRRFSLPVWSGTKNIESTHAVSPQ